MSSIEFLPVNLSFNPPFKISSSTFWKSSKLSPVTAFTSTIRYEMSSKQIVNTTVKENKIIFYRFGIISERVLIETNVNEGGSIECICNFFYEFIDIVLSAKLGFNRI